MIAEFFLVASIVTFGGWLRFHDLKSTGIADVQPDEARIGLGAASIIHYGTPIFNYDSPHEPPLSLYYPIPFILIFGRGLWVLKLAPIVFGLGALILTYLAGRVMFSVRVGAVSAIFLAVLPFAVNCSRILWEHSFLPFYSAGVLYCYAMHLKSGSARPLYFSSALLGLALSTKIIVLYFIFAFGAAALVSGRDVWPRIKAKQAIISFLFFILGAAPFIILLFLSNSFFKILSETKGGGIGSMAAVGEALRLRLTMSEQAFTPLLRFTVAAWAIVFVVREKLDARVVFLFVMIVVFLCVSIVTVSGLGIYHLLVLLPIPLVLMAGLIDLSAARSPTGALAASLAASIILVIAMRFPSFRNGTAFSGAGVNEMTAALESMDPDRTLPAQKDLKMIHAYLHYRKNGDIPPLRNESIVSLSCNRFRRCNEDDPRQLFPDFDGFYRNNLGRTENRYLPWDAYAEKGFFTPKRAAVFEKTLLELTSQQGYRYLIINLVPQPGHPFFNLNKQFEIAMNSLSRKGALSFKQSIYENRQLGYKIFEITPIVPTPKPQNTFKHE